VLSSVYFPIERIKMGFIRAALIAAIFAVSVEVSICGLVDRIK